MPDTVNDRTTSAVGHLYGVGIGPGDPELMTIKAHRAVKTCPVIAHFAARRRHGNAWSIIEDLVTADQTVLRLEYPVTTEAIEPADYERQIADFYDRSADDIAAQLDRGRDVAVVCEGDPFFYGSYMYIHQRLAGRYRTTVIPGVTSVSAASAAAGVPLVSMNETLTVLPGVMPPAQLKEALSGADAAVIMKVGRHLADVRDAANAVGLAGQGVYVERASCATERVVPLGDTAGIDAPYFSLVLIPGTGLDTRNRPDR
ncbi:MAG: cobI [Ilumatobacteraceae bacterium]|nr:cobI [Ilumatobacteraceae bacterium]MCU1389103.1 cobI [Ilumatobacteraceae bacterium]